MLNLLIFTLLCFTMSAVATWRYRKLAKTKHILSRSPISWFFSFVASLAVSFYYLFGSIDTSIVTPIIIFVSIAAALAVTSYIFNLIYKNPELGFFENMIDFTLFGMQRLLAIYIPAVVLMIFMSTQTTATTTFYFGNILALWVGFGAIYGAIHAVKKLKIDFD